MEEEKKYETIKRLVEENGSKDRAAMTLGITHRQVNRLIKKYKEGGKAAFVHGNRGRKPATTIPQATRQSIVDIYRTKYYDANFTHFTEILAREENIAVSESAVRSILEAEYILSPKVTKSKKKRIIKELEAKKQQSKGKKEADEIQKNLVAVEDAHSRRPRCAYFGELEQMDATPYEWIPDEVWHLHVAVDDATGRITGAWFDTQETLNGYYHVFYQILTNYGIPFKFLTDKRTVFTYKKKGSPSLDEDIYTQFAYACKQLGVELESTSVPQAKGRVERLNQTLQSRLPVEFRLAGITNREAANEFLNSYIKEFNDKFALPLHNTKSVFEIQPSDEKINLILSVLDERTVDTGHCIKFQNAYYRLLDRNGSQVHYCKGTKVMVIQAFDGNLFCTVNDSVVYALEIVPDHLDKSEIFDADYIKPVPRKPYIPPMSHPWKRASFQKFADKQTHSLASAVSF
jgi:transposase